MGSLFGDNKTTQTTSIPSYIEDAQKGLMGAAAGIATPFMQPSKYAIASQNHDQLKAAELARQSAMGAFNTDFSANIANAGARGYDPSSRSAATMSASQLDTGRIGELMNPFTKQVGGGVMDALRRERDVADARIGARSASGVAFGGSGPAIERAQLQRNYGQQSQDAINTILSQAYGAASSMAGAENAAENQARMANMQAENEARAANMAAANAAGQFNAGQGLQAQIAAAGASNNAFNNRQQSLQTLLGIGNQNQQYQQSVIDVPKNYASWLSGFVPGNVPQTTTTSTPTNPFSTLLGAATFL